MAKPIVMPPPAELGPPKETRTTGLRVDFDPNEFIHEIETKSPRWGWFRAGECPCTQINEQTDQPAPDCAVCRGEGVFWFAPSPAVIDEKLVGELTDVQRRALGQGAVIRGIVTSITSREKLHHNIGRWVLGDTMITVRPGNRLGFGDRLVCLDAQTTFREVITAGENGVIETRWPIISINLVAVVNGDGKKAALQRFTAGEVDLKGGSVVWRPGKAPAKGRRVSVHYTCHPTYIVREHPNVFRVSLAMLKTRKHQTPVGDTIELPLRARIDLDFRDPKDKE